MKDSIARIIKESARACSSLLTESNLHLIEEATKEIVASLKNDGKVIVFGNGGSASDSQHMVAELVGRFKNERRALAAIALTVNTSILTALSNDYDYSIVFKRQLEALARPDDVVIGISTSGKAENVIAGLKTAKEMGLRTIALTGKDGGSIKDIAGVTIIVKADDTPRIQEAHILLIHILCEMVEDRIQENQ